MSNLTATQKDEFLQKYNGVKVTELPEWMWAAILKEDEQVSCFDDHETASMYSAVSHRKEEGPAVIPPLCRGKRGEKRVCEACKNFSPERAVKRLHEVHASIAAEFSKPLEVVDVALEHNGSQHRHVFSIKNRYLPFTLSALATDYVRTKPRLSKNTRVHMKEVEPEDRDEKQPEIISNSPQHAESLSDSVDSEVDLYYLGHAYY
eukprot:TRINITY_DN27458_c0_g1_i1.p1 TRINITY_DN27458_c0_g1~~TRINITY_DN27458_c0_g1_i1.p1  ORF type:complete len:205 (+),score=36.90 TRINITY_DN27458_c0_g1_i1:63-677(+)